jgi:hypothetical protein
MTLTRRQIEDRVEEIGDEIESHRKAVLCLEDERRMLLELTPEPSPEPISESPITEPEIPRKKSSGRMPAVRDPGEKKP